MGASFDGHPLRWNRINTTYPVAQMPDRMLGQA